MLRHLVTLRQTHYATERKHCSRTGFFFNKKNMRVAAENTSLRSTAGHRKLKKNSLDDKRFYTIKIKASHVIIEQNIFLFK